MARKANVIKRAAGAGIEKCDIGTSEAGKTLFKDNVAHFQLNRDKYTALSGAEQTAFGALTVAQIVALAFDTATEF